jgi:hypothetical protein
VEIDQVIAAALGFGLVACEEPLFQASLIFVSEEEGFWMKAQRRVIHAIRRRKL